MICLRFIAVLGVILMPASFAHATTQDDSYIAGYAAGVLKQSLKLEMPSLNVKDGVITLPVGSLEAADQARAGVQFDNLQVLGRNLQILAEYYNGFSPSGQFYKDKVEYAGVGAHFHF